MTDFLREIELKHEVEKFYYMESRMLDDRKFLSWLDLLMPDIRYYIPLRHVHIASGADDNTDELHDVEHELNLDDEPAFRDEGYDLLATRARRSVSSQSWTENPPARTRRFVTNVELEANDSTNSLRVYSNFMLNYSRHGAANHVFSGQRRDELRRVDGSLRIAARRVLLDWNVITGPSLALLF